MALLSSRMKPTRNRRFERYMDVELMTRESCVTQNKLERHRIGFPIVWEGAIPGRRMRDYVDQLLHPRRMQSDWIENLTAVETETGNEIMSETDIERVTDTEKAEIGNVAVIGNETVTGIEFVIENATVIGRKTVSVNESETAIGTRTASVSETTTVTEEVATIEINETCGVQGTLAIAKDLLSEAGKRGHPHGADSYHFFLPNLNSIREDIEAEGEGCGAT
mmetsp:Transcript_16685/g.34275  ORF Transcript_16685/g.34275 Transcript_16685/m.34275 type:complete len:222 (+) Transcript_16685:538-1203(+)